MQKTSALYRKILAGIHTKETRVSIGDTGFLVDKRGNGITFGGTRILVGASGADAGYGMNILASVETTGAIFDGNEPTVGNVISRECDIKMLKPSGNIEGMSRIAVYVRLVSDGGECSEWLPQGVFYADSIDQDADEDDVKWLKIHGYDAILFAEQDYPADSKLTWPAKDIDVVREIAQAMGVTVDPRTAEIMRNAYPENADWCYRRDGGKGGEAGEHGRAENRDVLGRYPVFHPGGVPVPVRREILQRLPRRTRRGNRPHGG